MSTRLFVYGTLAPGGPNAHVLAPLGGSWRRGTVRGRLVSHGWAAELGYPALVLDEGAGTVPGQLFVSSLLGDSWDRLDEFEGPAYRREVVVVELEDGSTTDASVFVAVVDEPPTGASVERID